MGWSADVTNDPERDYALYLEILEDDEFRARLQRNDGNELVLVCYEPMKAIPALWLADLIQRWDAETQNVS